ncbi:MmgE/PrpD family protein [Sulfitobacter noctilucicola]|uniref:2-methylcitrate dehydratase PrpD n=1 Tax=Sulfitobacter noctilucicola TaxID=1342301 RepID=A0A7W6Q4U6_9RHOB|nr:MmgE/PrpD family protein [Sulfitobacter noctilucicola]KIN66335.1 MmgE/PrpD family protein [Sulfitobacter noctilucicola]MBB4175685.1 2-methylcitrate dehydratase PrpD [Sulfitobacter noctilucicola]
MTLPFQTFAADLAYRDLPPPLLDILRRSFLDTMGVAAVASTSDMAHIAVRGAAAMFGITNAGASRVLMDGRSLSPAGAAMAGAFTVDAVDAHDTTSPCKGHAGSGVFPALMAMADASDKPLNGMDFAVHLAIGYEISYRSGLAQHATCPDYHTSGAWTAVGIAAAAARVLGLTPEQIRHAAGIGEYHGPRSQMMRCIDHPTMVRDGVGWGAPSGITAAYLAREGFTGAPALTCEEAPEFWADLGQGWRTVEDTSYKPYPCCRWAHPSIDSVAHLMSAHDLSHQEIARVEIKTFHNATRLAGHRPATPDEFAYSIAFPVATMIVRGQIGVHELAPETLSDPDILRVSDVVELIDDDHFTRISQGKRWAQVTIHTKDGRRFEDVPRTPKGDSDAPLSDNEISEKFHLFADPVLGAPRAAEIETLATEFDSLNASDFSRLLDLCLTSP